ncbi:MAG: ribonuclease Z [bacterium]
MKFIVLGSGGTLPVLSRNLPSFALRREGELLLFDCGEGTQLQLMRARLGFGPLKRICISHLHGDHVTGIPGLLMTLGQSCRQKELTIYGPPGIGRYLRATMENLALRLDYEVAVEEVEPGVVYEGSQYRIEAAPADHGSFTLAYAFVEGQRPGRFDVNKARELGVPEGPLYRELQIGKDVRLSDGRTVRSHEVVGRPRPGRKVVYAIDTRPCSAVVELAKDADLLIHDSMFAEELRAEANERGHSTALQAAQVAAGAGVDRLILAHISPRYEDVTELLAEAQSLFPRAAVARDLMALELPVHK